MAREEFLLNLRIAASSVSFAVQTDSPHLDPDRLQKVLNGCAMWLTPGSVDDFAPDDFPELPPEKQRELEREVKRFRDVARTVAANEAAAPDKVQKALPHLHRIIELTREAVIAEWRSALDGLFNDVEAWSKKQGWDVQRDPKRVTESFLGEYEVPRLLVHTTDNKRYFLDPVARQVAGGGAGRVEMCLMPSYDSVAIVRIDKAWYVLPERAGERRRPWSRQTFLDVATRLANAA
jgi:hypothetical protein